MTHSTSKVREIKFSIKEILETIGGLENAVYGSTLVQMVEFERKDARNKYRESLADAFNHHWEYYGVDQGHWVENKLLTPISH